jgi:hypothetical protein
MGGTSAQYFIKRSILCGLALAATACSAISGSGPQATFESGNVAYETEASLLVAAAQQNRTQIAQTVQAAATDVAAGNSVNRQLLSTVSAGSTPTVATMPMPELALGPTPVQGAGIGEAVPPLGASISPAAPATAGGQFTVTGVAASVRASDGCIEASQGVFSTATPEIYATMRAVNYAANTPLRAVWTLNGTTVLDDTWSLDASYDQICLYYFIDPTDVAFAPGQWSVTLYANNQPIGSAISFTMTEG